MNARGRLLKISNGLVARWSIRHFVLKQGRLYWSAEEMPLHGPLPRWCEPTCFDFTKTECEMLPVPDTSDRWVLRPESGQVWGDQHRRAGTREPVILEFEDSQGNGWWAEHFRRHIAYGKAVLLAKRRRHRRPLDLQDVSAEELRACSESGAECAICLEALGGEQEDGDRRVVQTACGHRFHQGCVERWGQQASSCPVCRSSIERSSSRSCFRRITRACSRRLAGQEPQADAGAD